MDLTAQIEELASLPDHAIDPTKAALLIARSEYPDLDETHYRGLLDVMGETLKSRIPSSTTPEGLIDEANKLLFGEEGFQGNRREYYDPRNSFLNEVLDRKLGIPITLSLVYLHVGRKAGLPVYGVGAPGHFLVGFLAEKRRIFIDPFNNGRLLTEKQCRGMFLAQFQGAKPPSTFLDPVWPKQVMVRLMRNLKAIYSHTGAEMKTLRMIQWILTVDPKSTPELRERGLIYQAMGDPDSAIRDLRRYVELSPEAQDRESILLQIENLKQMPTRIH